MPIWYTSHYFTNNSSFDKKTVSINYIWIVGMGPKFFVNLSWYNFFFGLIPILEYYWWDTILCIRVSCIPKWFITSFSSEEENIKTLKRDKQHVTCNEMVAYRCIQCGLFESSFLFTCYMFMHVISLFFLFFTTPYSF